MFDLQNIVLQFCSESHFKGMPKSALSEIVYSGQLLNFPANTVLFREGDPAAGMYVLLSGQVRLMKTGLQGIDSIIYILKSMIMFNETTVIDGKPNPVTAIADQNCTTWQISPDRYQILMRRYPEIGFGLLCVLAERNRALLARCDDLMSRPVLARTAKLLLMLDQGGDHLINRYDHPNQRIAAMASTVPEAVSRSLKTLKQEGIIECSRAQIKILSQEKLSRYALIEPMIFMCPNRQEVLA